MNMVLGEVCGFTCKDVMRGRLLPDVGVGIGCKSKRRVHFGIS